MRLWALGVITFSTVYLLIGQFPQLLEYKILFLVACSLLLQFWPIQNSLDPYGLFHLSLNRLPGEADDQPPKTEWVNMGYWKDTTVFPEACEALARATISAARLKAGARVLDVGHGTGESLVTLLSHSSVPRPSKVTGITSLPVHHARSLNRVTTVLQSTPGSKPVVNLQEGDAIFDGKQENHPFHPSTPDQYDAILAIDCAYHFNTRETFLNQSFQKLAPGGRIALADVCLDHKNISGILRKSILSIARLVPKHNMVSIEEYEIQMVKAGYTDVQIQDITEDVFPSFIGFLKGRGAIWRCFAWVLGVYVSTGARFVIAAGSKDKVV